MEKKPPIFTGISFMMVQLVVYRRIRGNSIVECAPRTCELVFRSAKIDSI